MSFACKNIGSYVDNQPAWHFSDSFQFLRRVESDEVTRTSDGTHLSLLTSHPGKLLFQADASDILPSPQEPIPSSTRLTAPVGSMKRPETFPANVSQSKNLSAKDRSALVGESVGSFLGTALIAVLVVLFILLQNEKYCGQTMSICKNTEMLPCKKVQMQRRLFNRRFITKI